MNVTQRWRLKAERAVWRLDQAQTLRMAMWLVPLFFGLLALSMGQDNNWDLRNYHYYNPFAWLNGKVGLDLAPGQMQTYFNPTIDVLYYGLSKFAPAPLIGFIMGLLHGLNFLVLAAIVRTILPLDAPGRTARLPICLAFAGMLSANFIAQLGNTMGDNLTALFVLGALLLVLRHWPAFARGDRASALLLSGFVMGAGVGLKLTNSIYAPALCMALLLVPGTVLVRLRAAFLFGISVLAGIALTGGHWYWKMWTLFGNPLFPQFNNIFHGPMAVEVGVADLRFLPHDLVERISWPFIIAVSPGRVSEMWLSMLSWPFLYSAYIAIICFALLRPRRPGAAGMAEPDQSRDNALLLFAALAYLTWLNLFGIARYLMPLELLAPLLLWLMAQRLFPSMVAGKIAGVVVLLIIAFSFQSTNWRRTDWSAQPLSAEVPVIADPRQSMVLTAQNQPPMAWLATFYPRDLAFVSLVFGLESPVFNQRFRDMMAERKGPVYVMLSDNRAGVDNRMSPARKQPAFDANAETDSDAAHVLAARGLRFVPAACVQYRARVGDDSVYYRLCPVLPLVPAA